MKPEMSTIDRIRNRPRFKLYTYLSPEEYESNLKIFCENFKGEFSANINKEVATIAVVSDDDSFYKPYLSLRVEEDEGRTVIRGVFGPSSAVWTFFVFLYSLFGVLWMVFITLWFVGEQIKTLDYTWGLPLSVLMLVLIVLTYFASKYGQGKAKREMAQLRRFAIESTLKFEA